MDYEKYFPAIPLSPHNFFSWLPWLPEGSSLNGLQWMLVLIVTLFFLLAGIFRRAALIQISRDRSYHQFQKSRIRCMGNALVAITGGISLLTYLLIFVPKIIPLF
jgi:hypothetical protein